MGRNTWGWSMGRGVGFMSGAQTYTEKVLALNPIAYWPLNETSGTTAVCQVNSAQNGTYARDVSTMTTGTGIGDGNTAPLFDGTNDVVDIYTATFDGVFDGSEGTAAIWCKVSGAGVWTDGQSRYAAALRVDNNNRVWLAKNSANNQLYHEYQAGNVTEFETQTTSTTAWFHVAMTWSATDDEVIYYLAGSATETDTTLGTWAGSLAATTTVIGAQSNTPTTPWDGYLAHSAVWSSALSAADISSLATV